MRRRRKRLKSPTPAAIEDTIIVFSRPDVPTYVGSFQLSKNAERKTVQRNKADITALLNSNLPEQNI